MYFEKYYIFLETLIELGLKNRVNTIKLLLC